MLTGVRGVGKTTTARILARALNYELARRRRRPAPTIHMPELGVHCEAIIEWRHVDVLEMDAASHTGIDDVRQIIDGVRYAPGVGALQGLHHRRSAHALGGGLQRLPEDAGGAAAARQVRLRHHRDPQGAGDDPVALPALRPAPRRRRRARRAISRGICAAERGRGRARGAGADRPRRRRLGARFAVAARPGHRPWRRRASTADDGARHARPRRPGAGHRPVRGGDARRRRRRRSRPCARSTTPAPIRP